MARLFKEDGRKGIRNNLLVVYLLECAHHVAGEISRHYRSGPVQLIGFAGCYPNAYADRIMNTLCPPQYRCSTINIAGLREPSWGMAALPPEMPSFIQVFNGHRLYS